MIPHYFRLDDDAALAFVARQGAGTLVTVDPDGTFRSTFLPIVLEGDTILLHLARFNDQWKTSPSTGIMVVTGAHGHISSADYELHEGGTSASTWDYTQVTLHGDIEVHDDPQWVREAAVKLTALHDPTEAENLPEAYLDRATRAIIGMSLTITKIEAQAKLSQNKLPVERERIAARLRAKNEPMSDQLAADIEAAPSTASRVPYLGSLRSVGHDIGPA